MEETCQSESNETCKFRMLEPCHISVTNMRTFSSKMGFSEFVICGKGEKDTSGKDGTMTTGNWLLRFLAQSTAVTQGIMGVKIFC